MAGMSGKHLAASLERPCVSDFVFRGLAEKRALMERVTLISRESF